MNTEHRDSTSRREWMRRIALTLCGVPAMKAASIARDEAQRSNSSSSIERPALLNRKWR